MLLLSVLLALEKSMKPNDLATLLLDRELVDKVLDIVTRATSAPVQSPLEERDDKYGRLAQWNKRYQWKMLLLALVAFSALPSLALLKDRILPEVLLPATLVSVALAVLFSWIPMGLDIVADLPWLHRSFKQPYPVLMQRVRVTAHMDLQFLEELRACDRQAVVYVLRHYQHRRAALEKRSSALSGSIDKIGLFPATAGVALLWGNLAASPIGNWFSMLPPLIFIFHLFGLWCLELQERMDRIIALMDLRLTLHKDE